MIPPQQLVEQWRRTMHVEREAARRLDPNTRERELLEHSADTYDSCSDELEAALAAGGARAPQLIAFAKRLRYVVEHPGDWEGVVLNVADELEKSAPAAPSVATPTQSGVTYSREEFERDQMGQTGEDNAKNRHAAEAVATHRIPIEFDNHHNALACPYCNPKGLKFAEAVATPPAPPAWKPMDTAPTDGRYLLFMERPWNGHGPSFITLGRWYPHEGSGGEWIRYGVGNIAVERLTHWMPVPAPPALAAVPPVPPPEKGATPPAPPWYLPVILGEEVKFAFIEAFQFARKDTCGEYASEDLIDHFWDESESRKRLAAVPPVPQPTNESRNPDDDGSAPTGQLASVSQCGAGSEPADSLSPVGALAGRPAVPPMLDGEAALVIQHLSDAGCSDAFIARVRGRLAAAAPAAPSSPLPTPTPERDLLRRFVEKLDVILPKVDGIIAFSTVRSGHQAYDGPNLIEEMKDAKALLAAAAPAAPSSDAYRRAQAICQRHMAAHPDMPNVPLQSVFEWLLEVQGHSHLVRQLEEESNRVAAPSSPTCRVCRGSGFIAEKRTIDDGYGEVDSCQACAVPSSPSPTDGSVMLTAEDARGLAFLLARAIHEDDEASDADRREARKMLAKLGGDTQ